jgi:hypothetical protein
MMKMPPKSWWRKFGYRFLIVNVIFFCVKLTIDPESKPFDPLFSATSVYYYLSSFLLFMFTWEVNDWYLAKQKERGGLDWSSSLRIMTYNLGMAGGLAALYYYLGLFPFRERLGIICLDPPEIQFAKDFLRALLLGFAVIFFNMFYFAMKQREQLKKQFDDLQREVLASKYASLKSQISPHFLFNSLNTLTTLMYEDRDLASDFVSRLAATYRHILDHGEQDLLPLQKEIQFVENYMFMMKVRHGEAVSLTMDIGKDSLDRLIPFLALQMLVENALKHNYYSPEDPLHIEIKDLSGQAIVVRNKRNQRHQEISSTGVGLENIKRRYAAHSSQKVLIHSSEEQFEVILPLLEHSKIISLDVV